MGQHSVKVGGQQYRLWMGMSVLADVEEAFPDAFAQLVAGTLVSPPLRMVHRMVAGALERYHPAEAADRFFVDELLNENASLLADLLSASAPKAGTQPGNAKAPRTK